MPFNFAAFVEFAWPEPTARKNTKLDQIFAFAPAHCASSSADIVDVRR
jgi:hypothetical protein